MLHGSDSQTATHYMGEAPYAHQGSCQLLVHLVHSAAQSLEQAGNLQGPHHIMRLLPGAVITRASFAARLHQHLFL